MRWRSRRARDEKGYVAIVAALLVVPLIGMAALAVDVGQWYVAAREAQRAADAAALAGVPQLPGDPEGAFDTAYDFASRNKHPDSRPDVTVKPEIGDAPTKLRVTVSKKVPSIFGGLFGVTSNTITRTAVADYAGPVPLGSPCNRYGNDPEPTVRWLYWNISTASSACDDTGQFWGNVGSRGAPKGNGDAFQNNKCESGNDQCANGVNADYDPNGYFYTVTLAKPVNNLVIEAFDPALIHVGDKCESGNLNGASALDGTRYAGGAASPFCTGDIAYEYSAASNRFANQVATNFTVRDPGPNAWDPLSYPVRNNCEGTGTYPGYTGPLGSALKPGDAEYRSKPSARSGNTTLATREGYVASVFRKWVPLCTISYAPAGTYMVQVKTNGVGADAASGHNRFGLRAYSTSQTSAKDDIAISGHSKMAMYANLPGANTQFYLARVPSGAANQSLNIRLYDVGDSSAAGTIRVLAPPDSGVTFTNCRGTGVKNGPLTNCSLTDVKSSYNGKWQIISVQIPDNYRCDDLNPRACWVRLQYSYGAGNQPNDTTSWAANIEGDPVRLIE